MIKASTSLAKDSITKGLLFVEYILKIHRHWLAQNKNFILCLIFDPFAKIAPVSDVKTSDGEDLPLPFRERAKATPNKLTAKALR